MMTRLLPILLLCTVAHAELVDTLYFNGSPVAVEMSGSLPRNDTWSFGGKGTIVNEADRDGVTFGAFFPDEFNPVDPGGHGWVILPATSATASTDTPWALDMWTANPACLRFDVTGDSDPSWNPPGVYPGGEWVQIGTVISGGELLTTIMDSPRGDAFGIRDVPLGPWIVSGFQTESSQEMDGPIPLFDSQIIAAPEPATLAILLPIVGFRWRLSLGRSLSKVPSAVVRSRRQNFPHQSLQSPYDTGLFRKISAANPTQECTAPRPCFPSLAGRRTRADQKPASQPLMLDAYPGLIPSGEING